MRALSEKRLSDYMAQQIAVRFFPVGLLEGRS